MIEFTRSMGRQTKNTLECNIAYSIVHKYLSGLKTIDPFARNCEFAHPYTNDINPNTNAQDHLDAEDYLEYWNLMKVKFQGAILDPPFSARQDKEIYGDANLYTQPGKMKRIELALGNLVEAGGYVVKFGYNSNFSHDAFTCVGIHLIRYGGSMNDLIVSIHQRTLGDLGDWQ